MIRNLLATTAIATLLSTALYAQDTTAPAPAAPATQDAAPAEAPIAPADGFLATNLIGETVYNGTGDDAENIGEVNDIVIGSNGEVESIVIGVGGFLGLGEKNVAVNYTEADWAERDGDRWLVIAATKEQLEAQAEFDRRGYEPAPATTAGTEPAPATDQTATAPTEPAPADNQSATAPAPAAPATDQTAAAPADPAAPTDQTTTAAVDKSTLKEMPTGEMRAENLIGTTVYGANDEMIGEIGDVVLEGENVDTIIVDVGGFLGMGEKEVAVAMDNLAFMTDADGNRYLYTGFTKEQLDAQPAYDEATFAQNRDDQRMMNQ
ncbi:PRC-barrel domain-containing protein [Allomesorhizobium alhagi]|uniref:PRC-barrel domain-containing protein n=1 Tax=Mesorhizobium alhagi CCNWXJ12-2 TaxID=1107882 RepID=H0I2Y0_9HYPH|nr:PRC-barrel domain-containing protein [Mesorhizobium alhagi]EHK52662.1 PRC-barrel domain-containing protein [Mesorhizobium alhagi CCNWXJ12-2]